VKGIGIGEKARGFGREERGKRNGMPGEGLGTGNEGQEGGALK
jgi:hypothetical protein